MHREVEEASPLAYGRVISLVDWYSEINAPLTQAAAIERAAKDLGISITTLSIDLREFRDWAEGHNDILPLSNYETALPGVANLLDALRMEKLLEFYLTEKCSPSFEGKVLFDIGCGAYPFFAERLVAPSGVRCWAIDPSLAAATVGGGVNLVPEFVSEARHLLPSADAMTLHCSFEMFKPAEMTSVLDLAASKLGKGGVLLILPLYLAPQRILYTDATLEPPLWTEEDDADPATRVGVQDFWGLDWSEWLSPKALHDRLVAPYPGLEFSLIKVTNSNEAIPESFLRFIGRWTKID